MQIMSKTDPANFTRYTKMVKHGEESTLATLNHAASVLYKKLLLKNNGDIEVQHDPVMLNDLEPNYPVLPSTTRPGLGLGFRVRVRSGLQPTQSGEDKSESSG